MAGLEMRLVLPAQPEFVSVARLTLAGVASRFGFDAEQVEDIRVAVTEALTLVLRSGGAPEGQVELVASFADDVLDLDVAPREGAGPVEAAASDETALSLVVMEAFMDTARVDGWEQGRPTVHLRKARVAGQ